jgi:hypothetical protein
MKAFLIFTLSFFVAVAIHAQSDSASANKTASKPLQADHVLGLIPKINPMFLPSLFQNTNYYEFSLEKEFLKHESFQLTYEYLFSKNPTNQTKSYQSSINPEFRYYFNKKLSHSSFFVGTGMICVVSKSPYVISYENEFAAGINGGGRLIYKRIVLDFCFGLNTNFPVTPVSNSYLNNTIFTVVYGIGYRF